MKRLLLGFAVGVAGAALLAPQAFAHGGQFRGPGGEAPPGLREPSDPTPPPPPSPTTPPPTTTPPDPTTPNPTPQTPTTPSAQPPTTETPATAPGAGKKSPTSFDQWVFWWSYNNDDLLNLKEAIYALKITKESALGQVGESSGARTDATRATEKQVKESLIPAVLWAMDPKNKQHPDTESASYIALAKVTDDPSHIPLLAAAVLENGKKPAVDQIVNESAILALGLLRRTEKARQFDAKELDRVRDLLFEAFESDALNARARGFAALALGLLGDQPTTRTGGITTGGGLFYAPDPIAAGLPTAQRLFDALKRKYSNSELYCCLMMGLSMQPVTEITSEMIDALKECALKTRLFKENVDDVTASYAALAIGKVGSAKDIPAMLNAINANQTGANVKRSASIALGLLGRRIDGVERANLAVQLAQAVEKIKEPSTKNFGIMSLAYLLEADVKASRTDVLNAKGAKIAETLLKVAKDGKYSERPYGALAIALVGRAIGDRPEIIEYGQIRLQAIDVLQEGLRDTKIDKRARAAFAVALGLIKDEGARKDLVAIVTDKGEDRELRGYASIALGMIGSRTPDVVKAIKEALSERSSETLRQQTAIALGLLQTPDAVPLLLKELKEADTQNVQGQVVLALAQIGDARAIPPLVELLKDSQRPDLTRALACAGLGLIGDLELLPSLSKISSNINYRASPDAITEVLSIL